MWQLIGVVIVLQARNACKYSAVKLPRNLKRIQLLSTSILGSARFRCYVEV